MNRIKFSIIVPTFNLGQRVEECFASLCSLNYPNDSFEILVVDDCSTDDTLKAVRTFWAARDTPLVRVLETPRNLGPGGARQVGLLQALGNWVIFLDADDLLLEHSLRKLSDVIEDVEGREPIDLIAYNWSFGNAITRGLREGRRDLNCLRGSKDNLIKHYLGMEMDGSVIYTAFRRDFLSRNEIGFRNGFHEDVDFIFKAYCHAENIGICDDVLYQKFNRPESIIHTMSERHIDGVFRAWFEILRFARDFHEEADWNALRPKCLSGLSGTLAVQVLKLVELVDKDDNLRPLFGVMYQTFTRLFSEFLRDEGLPEVTRYDRIAATFLRIMRDGEQKPDLNLNTLEDIR